MDMVLEADVTSYCELQVVEKRNLVSLYYRAVMQFPVLQPAFLTLLKSVMVLVADVSSFCELRFSYKEVW